MTIERLRQAHRRVPFRPFVIWLADGQRCPIPHPEFLWIPPEASRTIGIGRRGENYLIVDPLLVTALDFSRPRPRRYGALRRRRRA
jgi:hypothetical protein